MSTQLLPCPFCGCALVANTNQADLYVRRYGTHYQHPMSACHLSDHEVSPGEVEEWNTRVPLVPASKNDKIARDRALEMAFREAYKKHLKYFGVPMDTSYMTNWDVEAEAAARDFWNAAVQAK